MRTRQVGTMGARRFAATVSCAVATVAVAAPPAARASYSWPLKPFGAPHPIRGGFCDPRLGPRQQVFHFGIDIAAPARTPVYAVEPGVVSDEPSLPRTVTVAVGPTHFISYWHVVPAVATGTFVDTHELLGRVARDVGHVHLAERLGGVFVNPLRPGALTPYHDKRAPVIEDIVAQRHGVELDPSQLRGRVDLVSEISDLPELPLPPPWAESVLTPATVAWRLLAADGTVVTPLQKVFDCTDAKPSDGKFWSVFAPGTLQNGGFATGAYRFWLARGLDTDGYLDGQYRVQVVARDVRGNLAVESLPITIRNDSAPPPRFDAARSRGGSRAASASSRCRLFALPLRSRGARRASCSPLLR
jgi:hypothetical protein